MILSKSVFVFWVIYFRLKRMSVEKSSDMRCLQSEAQLSGFTMIELLMVITLVAILGSMALPQFLDFRNEARMASIRHNLSALRSELKNQYQQALLRCGATPQTIYPGSTSLLYALGFLLQYNDVTKVVSGGIQVCTPSQIQNPLERKFFDSSSVNLAHAWDFGTDLGVEYGADEWQLPENPQAAALAPNLQFVHPLSITVESLMISNWGSRCGFVNAQIADNQVDHWVYLADTGEIFPGTNTAGFSECNF